MKQDTASSVIREPDYNPEAAADAWTHVLDLFQKTFGKLNLSVELKG